MATSVQSAINVYRSDIIAFAEAEYFLPESGVLIELMEHQRRILVLEQPRHLDHDARSQARIPGRRRAGWGGIGRTGDEQE